jgi:hypothetical protein
MEKIMRITMNSTENKDVAFALLQMLDGIYDKWWEVKETTGLGRYECERILHARDLAMHFHGREWLKDSGDQFTYPFMACKPDQFEGQPDQQVTHEASSAFWKGVHDQHYNDADRRFLLMTMLDRGIKLPDYVVAFYKENKNG